MSSWPKPPLVYVSDFDLEMAAGDPKFLLRHANLNSHLTVLSKSLDCIDSETSSCGVEDFNKKSSGAYAMTENVNKFFELAKSNSSINPPTDELSRSKKGSDVSNSLFSPHSSCDDCFIPDIMEPVYMTSISYTDFSEGIFDLFEAKKNYRSHCSIRGGTINGGDRGTSQGSEPLSNCKDLADIAANQDNDLLTGKNYYSSLTVRKNDDVLSSEQENELQFGMDAFDDTVTLLPTGYAHPMVMVCGLICATRVTFPTNRKEHFGFPLY